MRKFSGLTLLSAGLILAFSGLAVRAQDEADLRREKQLHLIYKKFASKPTPEQEWDEALSQSTEQTYQIQSGDTLWDVSETFFGDPEFWPKIWSLNKEGIFNPHEIEPNDQIQFVPGNIGEPPSFEVADGKGKAEKGPKEKGKTVADAAEDYGIPKIEGTHEVAQVNLSELEIPPPSGKRKKNAANPPRSFPPWQMRGDPDKNIKTEINPVQRTGGVNETQVLSYVQDAPLESQGEIVECEAGMTIAHENQYVVVRLKASGGGQRLLVLHEGGTVKSAATGNSGTVIEIDGELQIQEPVNAAENLFRALVIRAFNPIRVGDQLAAGDVQRVSTDQGAGGGSEANSIIVGGPTTGERKIFGPGELLFLDAGSGLGLAVGQSLRVYRVEKGRTDKTSQEQNPRAIGTVRVVKTADKFATAIVTQANEELHVGDSTARNYH